MSVCEIGFMVAVFAKPTSPGEIKDLLGIVIVALQIQSVEAVSTDLDLSLLSTPHSASRRQRYAPPVFAPLPKLVTTLRP